MDVSMLEFILVAVVTGFFYLHEQVQEIKG